MTKMVKVLITLDLVEDPSQVQPSKAHHQTVVEYRKALIEWQRNRYQDSYLSRIQDLQDLGVELSKSDHDYPTSIIIAFLAEDRIEEVKQVKGVKGVTPDQPIDLIQP